MWLVTSFVGFYSQFTRFCFMIHVSILLALLFGQVLSLSLLRSQRNPEEAKVLVRLECGFGGADDTNHGRLLDEGQAGLGTQRDKVEKKRSMRIVKVREESMANSARIAEFKAEELDVRMRCEYGHCARTDYEGRALIELILSFAGLTSSEVPSVGPQVGWPSFVV
ncbi:hypothetical protein ACJRO7_015950 [Eucalyptus globulus]|uniref:Uncharacterized protein n=1 Tax=Eucalyptus globulus TaxID=34317 RepID=A0ABD3L5L4_EUCGL